MSHFDIPELTPLEQYNANQARLSTCIQWILTKAYGADIPHHFQDPFQCGSKGQQLLKSSVIKDLVSSQIYCKACANLFKESIQKWEGHLDVIQALARKGIYVTDPHESAVTDNLLSQTSPFKLSCHISLIEALMQGYTQELVTVERVVQAVRKFSNFNASSELPYDTEDALLFWINKVCGTVRHRIGKGEVSLPGGVDQVMIPVIDDLLKDTSDGCCLATVISFYCPQTLPLQDIAMNDSLGIADSLHNLQCLKNFCQDHLPVKCDHLTLNDLFYSQSDLKPCFIVFFAELFHWLEVQKISVARSVTKSSPLSPTTEPSEDRPMTAKTLTSGTVGRPPVPISNATKKSFQQNSTPVPNDTQAGSPTDLSKSSVPPPRQPLLPKRTQHGNSPQKNLCRRSRSLTSVEERDGIRQSVRAWEEQRSPSAERPHVHPSSGLPSHGGNVANRGAGSTHSQLTNVTDLSQSSDSSRTLLANVSIDSEMSMDFSDTSVDISAFENTPRKLPVGPISKHRPVGGPVTDQNLQMKVTPSHPDYLELQSVLSQASNSPVNSSRTTHVRDKGNPHDNPHPDSYRNPHSNPTNPHQNPHGQPSGTIEPLMPAEMKPAKEKLNNNHTKEVESGEVLEKKSPTSPSKQPPSSLNLNTRPVNTNNYTTIGDDSSGSETPDEDYQTPSVESVPLPGESPHLNGTTQGSVTPQPSTAAPQAASKPRQFEAFYVNTGDPPPSSRPVDSYRDKTPVTGSFILHDQTYTAETARAAGIPIVDSSSSLSLHRNVKYNDQCSTETSDPELQKIRADNRDRETEASPRSQHLGQRPETLNVAHERRAQAPTNGSPQTSFAQIKQQKENGETSPLASGQGKEADKSLSLKAQFQKGKSGQKVQKKTTFAALPNQTTWQENAVDVQKQRENNKNMTNQEMSPTSSELIDIKMRLEERRRQIENDKRRMEVQWNKQRQKMGKQAFIQVINRGKSESDLREIPEGKENVSVTSKSTPSSSRKNSQDITVDADQRLAQFVQGQIKKTDGPKKRPVSSSSKVLSAPASREQSTDRDQHRATPPLPDKLHERLRSQSPREDTSQSAKPFSRQALQKTMDTAKDWLSEDEGSRNTRSKTSAGKPRPKSYHAPEEHPPSPQKTTATTIAEPSTRAQSASVHRGSQSLTASVENPNLGNYNTSLDRLNCSLSELQGEIMRLSLQQDQIKSLVVNDQGPSQTSKSPTPPPVSASQTDKYYLYPRNSVGEPDVAGSSQSLETSLPTQTTSHVPQATTNVTIQQPLYTSQQPSQPPTVHYPSQPQPQPQPQPPPPQPQYGALPSYPTPQYPQYMPGQGQPPAMYSVAQQQYPGMAPQQYPTSMYQHSPQMYQQTAYPGIPQNQWTGGSPMTQGMPQLQAVGHHQVPYTSATFQDPRQVAQTHTVSSSHIPSPTTSRDLSMSQEDCMKYSALTSSGSSLTDQNLTANHTSSPGGFQSPHTPTPPDVAPTSLPSPGPATPATGSHFWAGNSPPGEEPAREQPPPNQGFFITLDEGATPNRPKPKFPRDRRKDVSQERTSPEKQPSRGASGPPTSPPPRPVTPISPIGFVIGEDETIVENETFNEMEKKKQKLVELQLKRRQESEKKRLKKERENYKQKEEQRIKQEKTEQKKAEEKSRREAIFQEYLRRKTEDSADEEPKSSAGSSSHSQHGGGGIQKRSKTKPKAARPKSQPPPSGMEDGQSQSSQSHSSQEDLHLRGRSPGPDPHRKQTGHVMAFPGAQGDQADYQQLAFGGLTHRRPPTPDRQVKPFGMNDTDMAPNPGSSDYTGPKLFKKPSQKSNRTIMINAISHCCLAGTVNTSVKSKVLEGIAKSEAKHFIILFRDAGMQYKGLYTYDPEKEEVLKIQGVGPKQLNEMMMEKFYKYNSGTKSFSEVTSTKHLSATIDALVIQNHLWQKKPPATRRPPNQY